jgi:hypothetical protein
MTFLVFNHINNSKQQQDKNSVNTEISVFQPVGIVNPINNQISLKIIIPIEIYLKLNSFTKNQSVENKKTDLKISIHQDTGKSINKDIVPFYLFHLFPPDNDEIPLLS